MAAEADDFIIGTLALWAGDVRYAESRFKAAGHRNPRDQAELISAPRALMRQVANLRIRQIRQKRGEFRKLATALVNADDAVTGEPQVLETKHLRGCVWRTSEREFTMQAYLTDLSWQEPLFLLARKQPLAQRTLPLLERPSEATRGVVGEDEFVEPPGTSWIVPGNLFMQVEVSDLALIEVVAIWTPTALPQKAAEVLEPLGTVLKSLDEPEGSDSQAGARIRARS
jgi:hypothetical protein